MSVIETMFLDPLFYHYIGVFAGIAAFTILFFDLKTVLETDWNVFSSRFFLNAQVAMRNNLNVTRLLSLAVSLMVLAHIFAILQQSAFIINFMHAGATLTMTAAVYLAYHMKQNLHQPENVEEKDE